jgi:ubiquinone/menaquinone biosynthesis C-methylase UbiE
MKSETRTLKLDIGGYGKPGEGFRRDEDFTTVGLHETADVKANMWELPFDDNSVSFIWSSHSLEHVPVVKVHPTLKDWHRVLKLGCGGIVQVPNFDYVARYWLTGGDRAWAEAMVFGNQANAGEFHMCAFTSAGIKADLEAAGFEVLRVEMRWTHSQETLQAVFKKKKNTVITASEEAKAA